MPVKSKPNNLSFNEKFYWDKFNERRVELFKHIERHPEDTKAKEQVEFINGLLTEKNKGDLPSVWKKWEEDNFFWPNNVEEKK